MASTTFVDNSSIIYASWLNDVNSAVYNGTFISSTITPTNIVCNGSASGTGFTFLVNNTLSAPGEIGNGTPNTGAFTTLSLRTALSIANGGTGLTAAGSAGSVLTSNGTSWSIAPKITSGTAVASTSGTSIPFTGIPSWAKRITVMTNGISTNSASPTAIIVQLGTSGGIQTTGYLSSASSVTTGVSSTNTALGLYVAPVPSAAGQAAAYLAQCLTTIVTMGSNVWVSSTTEGFNGVSACAFGAGSVTLSGTLTQLNITTVNGTETFDAGSINIMYE